MTEQSGPRELVDHAVAAEEVGFECEVVSDHYFPWLSSQGHAPYARSVLRAVAHATRHVGLMTYAAVAGDRAVELLSPLTDHLVAVEPDADIVSAWNATGGAPSIGGPARAIGQIPICWDPEEKVAVERAHDQFRWFAGSWSVNADLPRTAGFAVATQFVTPQDVADSIPCGPDLDAIVEGLRPFWEAGFTDVALVKIGGDSQARFLAEAAGPLLEKLQQSAP